MIVSEVMSLIWYVVLILFAIIVAIITYMIVLIFRLRKLSFQHNKLEKNYTHQKSELDKSSQLLNKTREKLDLTEKELPLLKNNYSVLFNHSHYMIFSFYLTEKGMPDFIDEVNDVACALLERTREDLLKMTILEIEDIEKPTTMVRLFHRNELVMLSDAEIEYRQTTTDRQLMKQILNNAEVHYAVSYTHLTLPTKA